MITIYHNPRCRKSRAGLAYLQNKEKDIQIRNYMKDPVSEKELRDVISRVGTSPADLIRTQEEDFKKFYKGKTLSDDEWILAIPEHPKLLKRPLVISDNKGVWADPPENIEKLY